MGRAPRVNKNPGSWPGSLCESSVRSVRLAPPHEADAGKAEDEQRERRGLGNPNPSSWGNADISKGGGRALEREESGRASRKPSYDHVAGGPTSPNVSKRVYRAFVSVCLGQYEARVKVQMPSPSNAKIPPETVERALSQLAALVVVAHGRTSGESAFNVSRATGHSRSTAGRHGVCALAPVGYGERGRAGHGAGLG